MVIYHCTILSSHTQVVKSSRAMILYGSHSVFPVPGSTVGMVQGRYAYHHYMQDKFNDDVSAAPLITL